jgi:hypothetical protein
MLYDASAMKLPFAKSVNNALDPSALPSLSTAAILNVSHVFLSWENVDMLDKSDPY